MLRSAILIMGLLLLMTMQTEAKVVFSDDFENGAGNWSRTLGSATIDISSTVFNSESHGLRIGGSSSASAFATNSIATTIAGSSQRLEVEISVWIRRGSRSLVGSEAPDRGEDLHIQYRDSSLNWVSLETFTGSGTPGEVFTRTYSLGAQASHSDFRLRLSLNRRNYFDYWHVDDVVVEVQEISDDSYIVAGNSSVIAPDSGGWAWDGSQLDRFRTALETKTNFGESGTVAKSVVTVDLSSHFSLEGVDAFVGTWWSDSDSAAYQSALEAFLLAGGDVVLFQDNSVHDYIGASFGLATVNNSVGPTSPADPLQTGPFGTSTSLGHAGVYGYLRSSAVASTGGSVCGTDANGRITIACWDKGEYAAGAGRLVIVTDTDFISDDLGGAEYSPANAKGIFGLNLINYLMNGDGTGCNLGSFAITQSSYALACPSSRTSVQIEAMCSDGKTVKEDYTGTVELTTNENGLSEFYDAAGGGNQISSLVFDGTEAGTQNVYLFHRNENSDLRVTATDTSVSLTSTADTGTAVRTSGFNVTGASNFQCGTSKALTVTAIGQSDNSSGSCSVLTGFSGTKAMKAWFNVNTDPSESPGVADSVSQPMSVNGTSITDSSLPINDNLRLNFTDGEASVVLAYQDVGEVLALNLRHDAAPYDGSVTALGRNPELTGSAGPFIVYPDRMAVSVNSADAACSPASATCSAFTEAGADFAVALEAQCTGGAVAASYQGGITMTHALQLPSGGESGSLGVTSASITGADNGAITVTNQSISEVGVFDITANPETYFGQTVNGSTAANVGRFYPADFTVSVDSAGTFANACSGNFSYTGQSFSYLSTPQLRVIPTNTSAAPTQNYIGDFDRLGTVTINMPLQDTSQFGNDGSTLMQISAALSAGIFADDGINSWEKIYTLNAADSFSYNKDSNARIDEFNTDIDLVVAAVTDGDASASSLPTIEPVSNQIRYGRLRLENTFGSELEDLMMPVKAEYWNGSRWLLNSADECTTLHAGATSLASYTDNLDAGETDAEVEGSASGSATLVAGASSALTLSAPGLNNEGSVVLAIDASQLDDWLEFDWDNDPSTDNAPSASAQFGHYRGHDRIIYWREVSN